RRALRFTALHTPNRKRLSFTAATPAVPSRLRVELTPAKRSGAPRAATNGHEDRDDCSSRGDRASLFSGRAGEVAGSSPASVTICRVEFMNRLLIEGFFWIISTAPLFAQAQQPDAAKLKADARNLVGIIGSDKTKTK